MCIYKTLTPLNSYSTQWASCLYWLFWLIIYTLPYIIHICPGDLGPFIRVTVHWGKGSNQTSWQLLDTGSKHILIPRDSKHHCAPLVRAGAYGSQVINGVVAKIHLRESLNLSCGYFPSSGRRNWNRRTQQLGESPHMCLVSSWLFHQKDMNFVKTSCLCFIILLLNKAKTFEDSCTFPIIDISTAPGDHFTNGIKAKRWMLTSELEIFYWIQKWTIHHL